MRDRSGFSIMEMVVVIVILGVMTTITVQRIGPAQARYSVQSARTVLASMAQRTRAHAVEGAGLSLLVMDFAGDSATIRSGATTLDTFHFDDELGVDMTSSVSSATVCMNSKGYADTRCTSFTARLTVSFALNEHTTSLDILPLGQVTY